MAAINQDAPTDVVLARQPIFGADLHISAFELLYRAVGEHGLPLDPSKATATVLVSALTDVGLDRLVGGQRAFINVNREFLLAFRPLPLVPGLLLRPPGRDGRAVGADLPARRAGSAARHRRRGLRRDRADDQPRRRPVAQAAAAGQ